MKNSKFYLKRVVLFVCCFLMSSVLFEQASYSQNGQVMTEQEKIKDIEIIFTTYEHNENIKIYLCWYKQYSQLFIRTFCSSDIDVDIATLYNAAELTCKQFMKNNNNYISYIWRTGEFKYNKKLGDNRYTVYQTIVELKTW